MRSALYILLLALSAHASAESQPTLIGSYSNIEWSKSDDPHAEGYSLTLYQQGKMTYGKLCVGMGIEIPCTPITKIKISRNGMIYLQAKMSFGTEHSSSTGPEGRKAKQLIEFRGNKTMASLNGKLRTRNGYELAKPAAVESINLKADKATVIEVPTYEQWKTDAIIKVNAW